MTDGFAPACFSAMAVASPFRGERKVAVGERRTIGSACPLALDTLIDRSGLQITWIGAAALIGTGLCLAIRPRRRNIGAACGDHGDAVLARLRRESLPPCVELRLGEPQCLADIVSRRDHRVDMHMPGIGVVGGDPAMACNLFAEEITNGALHRFRTRAGSGGEDHMEGVARFDRADIGRPSAPDPIGDILYRCATLDGLAGAGDDVLLSSEKLLQKIPARFIGNRGADNPHLGQDTGVRHPACDFRLGFIERARRPFIVFARPERACDFLRRQACHGIDGDPSVLMARIEEGLGAEGRIQRIVQFLVTDRTRQFDRQSGDGVQGIGFAKLR